MCRASFHPAARAARPPTGVFTTETNQGIEHDKNSEALFLRLMPNVSGKRRNPWMSHVRRAARN